MTPYYQADGITIYHGDCRDVLPTLAPEVIITDPPYGTGGWRRTSAGAGGDPSGSLIQEAWDDGAVDWLALTGAPVAAFWPPARTRELLNAAVATGRTKHRCLYMRKRDPKPMVAGRTRWSVEPIWVMATDGFLLVGGDDVFEASTPRAGRDRDATGHPYQKPLNVMRWLVAKMPLGLICDPFMGSGTTLLAAQYHGRSAIGIEAEERWCDEAARRLSQGVLRLDGVS